MKSGPSPKLELRLRIPGDPGVKIARRRDEPVTVGLPFPEGRLADASRLTLLDSTGNPCPVQCRALDRWRDGTARWILVDFLADFDGEGLYTLAVQEQHSGDSPAFEYGGRSIETRETFDQVVIGTGKATFLLDRRNCFPFSEASIEGGATWKGRHFDLSARDAEGVEYRFCLDRLEISEPGPVRASVDVKGSLTDQSDHPLAMILCRLHFFAGLATVKVELTVRNPRPADHPGGKWCLGGKGSVFFSDLSFQVRPFSPGDAGKILCSPEIGMPLEEMPGPLELYQDSSGGENWRSVNHVNRLDEIPVSFQGYALASADKQTKGGRACPVVLVESRDATSGLAVPRFWENFPQAVEASQGGLTLRLFPEQFRDVHELQGGEQKTHTFFLTLAEDGVSSTALDWCREQAFVSVPTSWYRRAGVIPGAFRDVIEPVERYRSLVDTAIVGDNNFFRKRERVDEYGWRHFGDAWADHEAAFSDNPTSFPSHFNNQYDLIAGFAVQFMLTGEPRWHQLMDDMARHVIDIDLYHTDEDRAAYNHGMFWHTDHYVHAGRSTHRTYPDAEGVTGGGPSPSHLYTTGLKLHHFLTGCELSRQSVAELGAYVLDADDGRKSRFRLLDKGPTGIISESAPGYHGPGRAAANSIATLLDAHQLTQDRRFLEKADELVLRCIHPEDDLEARNLVDPESRWFYTMFLQTLGRYLDYKIELGQVDLLYQFAQSSLLHYGRWMADHEYPYLERPELLQFPTETWAAQDMRKSEVLNLAARHAESEERDRFLERARFFFDRSIDQLSQFETASFTRPLAILLTNGYLQATIDRGAAPRAPRLLEPQLDFGPPGIFAGQKERVLRRLKRIGITALAISFLLLVLAWLRWT